MAMFKKPSSRMFDKAPMDRRKEPLGDEGESWSPDDPAPQNRAVPVKPKGEIKGTDDTLRDKFVGGIDAAISPFAPSGRSSYAMAKKLEDVFEFNPVVGTAASAGDVYDAAKRGDKTDLAKSLGMTALNALGVKPMAGALKGSMRGKSFPWGEIDPFRPKVQRSENVLPGAEPSVEGSIPEVVAAAEKYAAGRGQPLKRQSEYAEVDPERGRLIADAYQNMKHAPDDPKVQAAYGALSKETMAQWDALEEAGIKIDFIKPGAPDPYPGGPREALADLRGNKHLYVFPTKGGFGSDEAFDASSNPLLASTGRNHGGHDLLVNDAFRAVHDVFGHGMEGARFGARGEENAWQAHKRLFSDEAMPALTSETRGQNSWVNFGPKGEANRAMPTDTHYADQKVGIMPSWTRREKGLPVKERLKRGATPAFLAGLAGSEFLED